MQDGVARVRRAARAARATSLSSSRRPRREHVRDRRDADRVEQREVHAHRMRVACCRKAPTHRAARRFQRDLSIGDEQPGAAPARDPRVERRPVAGNEREREIVAARDARDELADARRSRGRSGTVSTRSHVGVAPEEALRCPRTRARRLRACGHARLSERSDRCREQHVADAPRDDDEHAPRRRARTRAERARRRSRS